MILFIRSSNYHIDGRLSRYLNIFKGKLDSGVLYWDRKNENAKNDNFRFYFPSSYGNGLRSIIGFVLWNFYILFFLIKNRKAITCVHAINLDTIIPVLIAKPIIKGKVVYDIYDCYADSHSIGGLMNYFVKRVERLCCSLSDTIILPDESRIKQSLLENSDFDIMIIENVPAIDCINLKEELHAEVRKIKFIYAGNLQKKYEG
ncbi:hypothetical protein [Plesiomonas shigelloides]|nr:hypothetical protein [Plesiomonas shigelloides]KAB7697391.1 hypothetical protein GBN15_07720 [Plesiomonas shigelloides]